MKRLLHTFLLLFFVGFTSIAQNKEVLKVEVEKMYEASYILDYDAILNYTHPKLFDLISKEQMTQVMQNLFENEAFRIRFVHPKVSFSYGEFQKINGTDYCVINYNNAMRMTFEKKLSDEEVAEMIKNLLASKEYDKATYEKDRNSFFIEGKSTLIAVLSEATNNQWKFVNYSVSQVQLAKTILGDDVLAKLGL